MINRLSFPLTVALLRITRSILSLSNHCFIDYYRIRTVPPNDCVPFDRSFVTQIICCEKPAKSSDCCGRKHHLQVFGTGFRHKNSRPEKNKTRWYENDRTQIFGSSTINPVFFYPFIKLILFTDTVTHKRIG